MRVHAHIPIGEIAAALPHVTKLLDVLGVDYVLHGNLSLRDAAAEAGLDPVVVRHAIDSLPRPAQEKSWSDASMQELISEIRDRRHPKMHSMLAGVAADFNAVASDDPNVRVLHDAFAALCTALSPHMVHEERMFFPVVQHLEDCWTRGERPSVNFLGGIGKAMSALVEEHVAIVGRLNDMRTAAQALRDDGADCTRLLDAVSDLEHELRDHIHLENNVLYPRATAVEDAVQR